jgi:hypothetical protein
MMVVLVRFGGLAFVEWRKRTSDISAGHLISGGAEDDIKRFWSMKRRESWDGAWANEADLVRNE